MEDRNNISVTINAAAYEAAIDRLAKRLHWKMEHLDPSDFPDWHGHPDKEFYRSCVRWVTLDCDAISAATGLVRRRRLSMLGFCNLLEGLFRRL